MGLRSGEGPRADLRVRAPHGRPRERMRARRAHRRWALGMVTVPRWRASWIGRRAGAKAPRVHSGSREEDLFFKLFGPRRERLASAYLSTSAATLCAATGIFTAQPTPNTRSLKI